MNNEYFEKRNGWSISNKTLKSDIKNNTYYQNIRQKIMKDKIKRELSKRSEKY